MDTRLAAPVATVALALRPYVDHREWLADPFPALARAAAGAPPIGIARASLIAATSSIRHAVDGPGAREVEVALASALTAKDDRDVADAAARALKFLYSRGDGTTAQRLAHGLLRVSCSGCMSTSDNCDGAADDGR